MQGLALFEKYYSIIHNTKVSIINYKIGDLKGNLRKTLRPNSKFKDKYRGKRCFVLGNGPSLRNEDLSSLEKEYVFTVNQVARTKDFQKLKTNFHFWADPNFFIIDSSKPEDSELLNTMLSVNAEDNKPECFFPIEQKDFIKKFSLDKSLNVNYFATGLNFHDGYKKEIDYTKFVPGFGTVVMWCITMAIYMGFKEIYILGCDNTGIITSIRSVLHQNDSTEYAYEVSSNEKKRMESLLVRNGIEAYTQSYLETLKEYRRLYKYCTNRGIKLVNCSSETVIDSIPRKRLSDVLR